MGTEILTSGIWTKAEARDFAGGLVSWADRALKYLDPEAWGFRVDAQGRYLPAVHLIDDPPAPYEWRTASGSFRFRVPPRTVRLRVNVEEMRWELQGVVARAIWNSTGDTSVRRGWREVEKQHGLKPYRTGRGEFTP